MRPSIVLLATGGMLAMAVVAYASSSTQVEQLAPLNVPRTAHTATVLADGSVLITGGRDAAGTALAVAEIFDQKTRTSKAIGDLVTARTGHTATLLKDGRVLIAGGANATGLLASAETFDPLAPSSAFRALPAGMGAARTGHTATLLNDGKVLLAGGDAVGTAELFDPASGSFSITLLQMAEPRTGHTATLFSDDTVLLAGGQTDSIETFNGADQTFTLETQRMTDVRIGHEAISLSNTRLLFFGGDAANTVEQWDFATDTLALKATMDAPASSATLLANGKILVLRSDLAGIYSSNAADESSAFTAFDETAMPASGLLARRGQTATQLSEDKRVLVAGGVNAVNELILPVAIFNPAKIWTDKDDYFPDERVLLDGSGWKPNEDIYLFVVDSATEQWTYKSTVKADANGNFAVTPYFIVEQRHLGVTFDVTAYGAESVMTANVRFTDAINKSLAFTTTAFTRAAGVVFGPLVVQARKSNGDPDPVSSPTSIDLTTDGSGTFFAELAGTNPITAVVIPKSANSANFYYKANTAGTGSHTITATDPTSGGNSYGTVSQVETISKVNQTIAFDALANKTFGDPDFAVNATASSGLTPTFSIVSNPPNATISGNTVHPTSAGIVTVRAAQPGDSNYNAAPNVDRSFTVAAGNQTITFGTLADKTFGDDDFTVSATASSGLTPTFSIVSIPPNATISGNTVHITGAGMVTVRASQSGDTNYNAAPDVDQSFTVAKAAPVITWNNPGDITYGTALSATELNASISMPGNFVYSPASGTVLNAGNAQTLSVEFTPTDTTNYNSATKTASINVLKADATITVSGYTGIYDGYPHGATGSAKGVNDVDLSDLLHLGNTFTDVPGGTSNWSFDGDTNYNSTSGTAGIVINKADATVRVEGYTRTYDGNPHGATGSATGVNGEALTGFNLGNTFTDVPGGTANWSFDGNGNYNSKSGTAEIVINKAEATVSVEGYTGTYDGNPHGATGSAIGVAGEALTGLDLGNTFTEAPGGTASWSFAGNDNYNAKSGTAEIVIGKANAAVSVEGHTGTYDGDAHGANGSATGVNGEDLSSLLNFGVEFTDAPGGTATWSFTGDGNYNSANGTAAIEINKADAIVSVSGYTGTYDGAAHAATGSATGVNGENLTSLLDLGDSFANVSGGTVNWSFAGNTNYNSDSGTVVIAIDKANATVSVEGYTGTYDGAAHGATGSATGVNGEDLSSLLDLGNSFTDVPGGTANWSFAGNTNYNPTSGSAEIVMNKANATLDVDGYTGVYDSGAHAASGTATGVKGESLSSLLSLGNSFANVPGGTAHWNFAGNDNYNSTNGSVEIVISKAEAGIMIHNYAGTYDGGAHGVTATIRGADAGGTAAGGTFSSGTLTDAPGGTVTWSFSGSPNYNDAKGNGNVAISKATADIVVIAYTKDNTIYDALPHTAGARVKGVDAGGTAAGGALDLSGTTHTNAGTYTGDAWSFNGGTNYYGATGTVNDSIAKADAHPVITPYNVTYDTLPHTATATATGVDAGGVALGTSFTLSGTTHTNAGDYPTDSWSFSGGTNYKDASGTVQDVISPRDALVSYIGQTTFVTSGSNSTTAQVTLSASVQDPTGTKLVGAKVDFLDISSGLPGKVLASGITVSPVANSTGDTGTANTIVTLSSGQYGAESYMILVRMTRNYDNILQPAPDKTAGVVIAKPAATTQTTGAGKIAALGAEAGTFKRNGDDATFSVGLTYNNKGTNLQGKITLAVPQSDGSVLYVKSNSISSMAVTAGITYPKNSTIYTKATVYKVLADGSQVTIDGGISLRLDVLDGLMNISDSSQDKVGFTVLSSKGSTLYYSNNWVISGTGTSAAWKTDVEQLKDGMVTVK